MIFVVNWWILYCPAYNYLIKEGKKIGIYGIGEEYNGMYGLGIPKDLEFFYENYEYAILNIDTYCEIRISSLSELQPTNQILYSADDVIWEELADDISNDWFMIASSQELSQYISIDLNKKDLVLLW